MTRRRVVVLASAATLFALGGMLAAGVVALTRTAWGREQIRSRAEAFINTRIQGKMHIGRIEGSLFTSLVVDSFSLSEKNDSLFIATGRLTVRFDPRDLLERRIVVQELTVERPYVHVHEDSTGTWNFRKIFPPGPKGLPTPPGVRNFGDYIVANTARLEGVTFRLTMPWSPDDTLRGARRDSAITYALGRPDKVIRRAGSHFTIERLWTNGSIRLGRSRIDDKDMLGRQFVVDHLDADESDPPFAFRNVSGTVRNKGDSVWVDLPHFELPGSSGSGKGKVWWGSDLPTRYDLTFDADTVSLADVAWVYPTLPTTGGGRLKLAIRNQRDLRVMDYVLSDMDVRTMGSRLRGTMTFATGAPVFIVKDLDVRAEPIDWAFIEQFVGEPLPYPWRGTIDATLRARGGAINRFRVDEGTFFFRDANVPGATARGTVSGELDMLDPAFTQFRGFDVALDHFDLRTLQFLNPDFPRFSGIVSGRATLDSVWTDVRFRQGDITHRFADGEPSRFVGNGRVTIGDEFLIYDLAVDANPLNITTVARAYPEAELEFRGAFTGPVRLQGQIDDLSVFADLTGQAGRVMYDGRIDADSAGGYGYHGTLGFRDLDLRSLYDTVAFPATSLNGTAIVDLVGDSIRNYAGTLDLTLDRSLVDSVRVYTGARARLRFADQRLHADTLHVETALASVAARGAIGVQPGVRDSLHFLVTADSLGALRQYLVAAVSEGDSVALREALSDSLGAEITGRGVLLGSLDTLGVRAALDIRGLTYGASGARIGRLAVDLDRITSPEVGGTASFSADTLRLGTVAVRNAALDLEVRSRADVGFSLLGHLSNGPVIESRGTVGVHADTVSVALREMRLALGDREWALARPATIVADSQLFVIDTVRLDGSRGGSLTVAGAAPRDGAIRLVVAADSVALADLATMAQSGVGLGGALTARLDIAGSRETPEMQLTGTIVGAKVGQVNLARASITGNYDGDRLRARLGVIRGDTTVVDVQANLPLDLALATRDRRLRDDTLRVSVRSANLDMEVVESFVPSLSDATGRMSANFALAGRPGRTAVEGFMRVDTVATTLPDLGIRLRNFNADLVAERDTLRIRRLVMVSGEDARDSLWLGGWVARRADEGVGFDVTLGAREFKAIARRRTADLSLSASLRLDGSLDRSRLSGSVLINNGFIVIPEFTEKKLISLDDPELYNVVDTTVFANRALLPKTPPAFVNNLTVDNVRIAMGPDVRVRSAEADIKLGGAVNVTVGQRRIGSQAQLALDGNLQTERGFYRLDLGGLVQRTFTVEGGQLSFFNETDLNPVLNISAIHTVRQLSSTSAGRNDVRIRVRVLGTLTQPRLALESADSLQLSESDLISYLVAGVPSFGIGGGGGRNSINASAIALGTLSSLLSQRFSGGLFDYVSIQTAYQDPLNASRQGLLAGAQFGVGKQLGTRTFVSLSTGLCRLGGTAGDINPATLAQSVGIKLEQRLTAGYGFAFSLEPPLNEVLCVTQDRSFTTFRHQYSFDIFRAWRW